MALIQAAFARPRDGASKLMTFQSIAEATRLPVNEVEHLIMKALRWVSSFKGPAYGAEADTLPVLI
jgi:hypothetical protein